MRKLAAVIGLLAAVSLASAAPIATTDFLGVNLTGANQTLDLLTHSGSTVDAGVASAAWTSGPDLTAVGTVGGNSIWATGWDGTAGDYIKLSVELDASYSAVIEQIRFATRRSGTGPTIGLAQLYINGGLEYTYNINMGDTNYQNVDVTGLSIAAPAGADIELRFVGSGGGMLHVVEEEVRVREHFFHFAPGCEAGGFDRRVEPTLLAEAEDLGCEAGLCERFSSAQSDSPARAQEERGVLRDFLRCFLRGHPAAFHDTGPCVADLAACPAGPAELGAEFDAASGAHDRALGTGVEAGPAGDARVRAVEKLGLEGLRFGIGAPETPEPAAFQEEHRPDARSVVDGVALNVEDEALPYFRVRNSAVPSCG